MVVIEEEPASAAPADGRVSPGGVDVRRLADKVYQLMLADVRLGQARGEPSPGSASGSRE